LESYAPVVFCHEPAPLSRSINILDCMAPLEILAPISPLDLPVKNTFVSFDEPPEASPLWRALTCPPCFAPGDETWGEVSTDDESSPGLESAIGSVPSRDCQNVDEENQDEVNVGKSQEFERGGKEVKEAERAQTFSDENRTAALRSGSGHGSSGVGTSYPDTTSASLRRLPSWAEELPKCWADLESDSDSEPSQKGALSHARSPDAAPSPRQGSVASTATKLHRNLRWADLSSPDITPRSSHVAPPPRQCIGEVVVQLSERAHSATLARRDEDIDLGEQADVQVSTFEDPEVAATKDSKSGLQQTRGRPVFQKATREARARQVQSKIDDFCSLSFNDVDAAQQMGLTHRMLVLLKGLADVVSYWDEDGKAQVKEEAFKLLDLEEEDMYAIGHTIKKAARLIDEQCYHDAYDKLCSVRPWFSVADGSDKVLEAQRNKLRVKALARATAKAEKEEHRGEADTEGWTEVPSKKQKEKERAGNDAGERGAQKGGARLLSKSLQAEACTDTQAVKRRNQRMGESALAPTRSGVPGATTLVPRRLAACPTAPPAARQMPHCRETGGGKLLCRYEVGIEEDRAFRVCRRLIGPGGEKMKRIIATSGGDVKLRIRGRGSNYLEGEQGQEAEDPLMLCLSAPTRQSFAQAASMVEELLRTVHDEYRDFCRKHRQPAPTLTIHREMQRAH